MRSIDHPLAPASRRERMGGLAHRLGKGALFALTGGMGLVAWAGGVVVPRWLLVEFPRWTQSVEGQITIWTIVPLTAFMLTLKVLTRTIDRAERVLPATVMKTGSQEQHQGQLSMAPGDGGHLAVLEPDALPASRGA